MIFNLIILDKNKIKSAPFYSLFIHYFTINLFQLCSGWMSNNSSFTSLFLLGFIFYHGIRGDCIVSDVGSCLQVNGYIGVWKSKIYCTLLGWVSYSMMLIFLDLLIFHTVKLRYKEMYTVEFYLKRRSNFSTFTYR